MSEDSRENSKPSQPVTGTMLPNSAGNPGRTPVTRSDSGKPETAPANRVQGTLAAPAMGSPDRAAAFATQAPPQRSITKTMGVDTAAGRSFAQILGTVSNQRKETLQTNIPRTAAKPAGKQRAVGKSTWNLKIHKKHVAGQISGIANQIQDCDPQAGGLMSAFLQGASSPEYEIKAQLGEGSMGVVYRATQTSLNRPLAIKTLKSEIQDPVQHQEMFVSEAVVTANLVHPNIVPIHDLGHTEDGKLFYSMKQVNGTSWDKLIAIKTQEENLEILMKVCDAVAYAHSRGVINRDLKPENVVVGDFGEVIVLDWGLAVTTERFEKRNSVLIEYQGGVGTPVYMAPELASEDVEEVCPQSDIYLLGAILFEILEGYGPHYLKWIQQSSDPEQTLAAVCQAVIDNEIERDVKNTGELMQIARKAMATHPRDRYATVEQFQEAIREYRITGRAEELLHKAKDRKNDDYDEFQQAVALFSDALERWPSNQRAIEGDLSAREAFARLALKKGDYDLGLEVVSGRREPVLSTLATKLKKARRFRTIVKSTWVLLFVASVVALVALDRQIAVARTEKEAAKTAISQADIAKTEAEAAKQKATSEEAKAAAAKTEAEAAKQKATSEEAKAAAAKAEAEAAKQIATSEAAKAAAAKAEAEVAEQIATSEAAKAAAAKAEAEAAKQETTREKENAEKVKAAAEQEKIIAQIALKEGKVRAAIELNEYASVITRGQEAVDFIRKNLQKLNEKKQSEYELRIDDLEKEIRTAKGNHQAEFSNRPTDSVISADGSHVALLFDRTSNQVIEIVHSHEGMEFRQTLVLDPEQVGITKLFISANGSTLVATGVKTSSQPWIAVWHKTNDQFGLIPVSYRSNHSVAFALFAKGGDLTFLIEKDSAVTIHVLDSRTGKSRFEKQLFPKTTMGYLSDAIADPNGKFIVGRHSSERDFQAFYTNPEMSDISSEGGDAPKLSIAEAVGQRIDSLEMAPDGNYLLACFFGPDDSYTMTLTPRAKETNPAEFPFAKIEKSAPLFHPFGRERPIAISISHDGSRIAASLNRLKRNNVQLWDVSDLAVKKCNVGGLKELAGGETLMPGMASRVDRMAFQSPYQLLCVSHESAPESTQRLFYWNLSQLESYKETLNGIAGSIENFVRELTDEQRLQSGKIDTRIPSLSPNLRRIGLARPVYTAIQNDETDSGKPDRSKPYVLDETSKDVLKGVFSADFSEDGRLILVGASDLAAHVYESDLGTKAPNMSERVDWLLGLEQRNYFVEGHNSEIKTIRFLPTKGDLLFTSENLGVISVWDAKADADGIGQERSRLFPLYATSDFVISEDGQWILAGGAEIDETQKGKLRHHAMLWSVEDIRNSVTPNEVRKFSGQHAEAAITAVAISPNSQMVLTCGRRGKIVLWNLSDGKVITSIDETHEGDAVSGAAFINDTQFLTSGFDGKILLWTIEGNNLKATSIYEGSFILRMEMSPDHKNIVFHDIAFANTSTQPSDSTLAIRLLNVDSQLTNQDMVPLVVRSMKFTAEQSADVSRSGCAWFPDSSTFFLTVQGALIQYSTDGKELARFELNSPDDNEARLTNYFNDRKPMRAAVSPISKPGEVQIATLSGRHANLWNLSNGKHLAEFRTHHSQRLTASFSPDQKFVLSASETLRMFDAEKESPTRGRTIFRIDLAHNHTHPLTNALFSPVITDGVYQFVSCDQSGELRLWSWTPTGPPVEPLDIILPDNLPSTGTIKAQTTAVWSKDGRRIASVRRGTAECWDVVNGKLQLLTLETPKSASKSEAEGTEKTIEQWLFNDITFSRSSQFVTAGGVAKIDTEFLPAACVWRIEPDGKAVIVATLFDWDRKHTIGKTDEISGITAVWQIGRVIVTGGLDGSILKWTILVDVNKGVNGTVNIQGVKEIATLLPAGTRVPRHTARITSLKASPLEPQNSNLPSQILSSDDKGKVIVWPGALLE